MATSTFDTLSVARELEAKGIEPDHAEAIVKAIHRSSAERVSAHQVDNRFGKQRTYMDGRFDKVDARFDRVDARFDRVDARFEQVDARFDQVDARFEEQRTYVNDRLKEQRKYTDSQFAEHRAHTDAAIAKMSVVFHRAIWLQGASVVSLLIALYTLAWRITGVGP